MLLPFLKFLEFFLLVQPKSTNVFLNKLYLYKYFLHYIVEVFPLNIAIRRKKETPL